MIKWLISYFECFYVTVLLKLIYAIQSVFLINYYKIIYLTVKGLQTSKSVILFSDGMSSLTFFFKSSLGLNNGRRKTWILLSINIIK